MSDDPTDPFGDLPGETLALIAEWLPAQRWFAGKGQPIDGVRVLSHTDLGGPGGRLHHLVLAVDQAGETAVYQVPLGQREQEPDRLAHAILGYADGTGLHDGLHDKELTALLLEHLEQGDGHAVGDLAFHRMPGAEIPVGEPSLVLTGEQSNSSLAFGSAAILKVFRRLTPGSNPDIEVHDALTRDGCAYVAPLLGWIDGRWNDPHDPHDHEPREGSLAMLQTFLVTATDGWRVALTSLRDLLAEGDLAADEVGGDFAAEAERLGVATAEVHAALARTLPHGVRDREGNAAVARWMRSRLDATVGAVAELKPYAPALRAAFSDLAVLDGPTPIQRIHGDYHLGQVMRTSRSWKLLDFEGEPSTPLADRTSMDSPIRDVAGMLRSFDYAARHQLVDDHPSDAAAQRAYRAAEWAARNRSAFCDGYAHGAGHDPRDDAVLLRAYEIDKAVYEAGYEARFRPSWLAIPLAAVERLAAEALAG